MTNAEIITEARFELMKQGLIGTTGRMIEVVHEDGTKTQIAEPEEIHTYRAWKEMGYQVQKGQKAVASFLIWKHTEKEDKETGKKDERMFMKNAYFFKRSQVEAMA